MSWMERLRQMLSTTSPMTASQSVKKLMEMKIDEGIHFMMGGWFWDARAAAKEAAKASGQTGSAKIGAAAANGAKRMVGFGGRLGQRLGGFGARRLESFMASAPGVIGRGIKLGTGVAQEARTSALGLGKIGQLLLTGKGPKTSFGEAFFPFFKTHGIGDPAKYALNPTIARRLIYAAAPIAVLSGLREAMAPAAPPPSVYFDGRYMRHINDMGAGADYGQKMLGPNSTLNEDARARLISQIGHLL